ncbi:hypothetical protein ACS0TY_027746 [Phlomoides rotata]
MEERELQMLNELIYVINRSTPLQGIPDSWKWGTNDEGRYMTKATYEKILTLKMGRNACVYMLGESYGNGFQLQQSFKEGGFFHLAQT